MGFRVNRRIKIAKGLSLNVSKSGISASAKVGRVTVNSRRGATVNIAKGVSYRVPAGQGRPRRKAAPGAATARPMAVGPLYFRRPFGFPGWCFWTIGIVAALLLGAIPYAGPAFLLAAVGGLAFLWLRTPRQLRGVAPAHAEPEQIAPAVADEE